MANRDIVYGIRITANSASAVAETQKVDKAFGEVGAALGKVVVEAEKAESSLSAVVSPTAQTGLQAEASALGSVAEKLDQVAVGAGKAEASLAGVTSKPLQGVQAGSAALGATAEKLNQVAVGAAKADAALSAVATKSVQAASPAAAASLGVTAGQIDRVGVSAAQTAQALRQLPMQFSDIVVSLQAGQSPMQVLLQQGSQIKDQFGGIGPAAQAMGGYIAGLVGPFTIAAGAVAGLALAYYQGSEESTRFATGLILTGNVVGKTVDQLSDLAKEVSVATRSTQAFAADALSQVVSSGAIAAENIGMVTEAAVRMERATGQSVGETIKQFIELGKEPVKASEKLNETANYLTADLYKQIRALAEHGKASDAAALAQKGWADALNERTTEITQNLGHIEAAWGGVIQMAKAGWDAVLGVGRTQSRGERIAELEQKAAPGRGIFAGLNAYEKVELAGLKATVEAEEKAAKAAADRAAHAAAVVKWQKDGEQYRSNDLKREQAIAQVRQDGLNAKVSEEEIEKRIALIREKYKDPVQKKAAKSPGESIEMDWTRRLAVLQAEAGATTQLTDTEKAAVKVMTEFAQGKLKLTAAEKARLPGLVQEALLLDDAAEAAKRAKIEQEALAKAQEAAIAAVRADTQALLAKLDAAQFEAETYGMTEEAVYRLLAARAADRAEMNAFGDANDAVIAELKAQAKAYLDLADAAGAKAGREAQRKAVEESRASAQRFADDLERSLTDALMRGFEAGKGFGESFVDSLRNTLKTAVLKAAVQLVISPVTSGIGASGLFGAAGTPGGAGGAGGLAQLPFGGSWLSSGLVAAGGSSLLAGTGLGGFMTGFGTAGLSGVSTLGSIEAGMSLLGTAGGGAAGAGMIAGAVAPWAMGALLAAQALGAFEGSTPHTGGAYTASTSGAGMIATDSATPGFNLGWGAYRSDRSSSLDEAMKTLSSNMAKTLSQYGSYDITSRFASDNNDWSEGAIRVADAAGNVIAEVTKRYTADANQAINDFSADTGRAMLATLQKVDIAPSIDAMLDGLDPLKSSIDEINAALERAVAWGPAGEALAASIDSAFLTPAAQLQVAFDKLGVAVPSTTAQYEALVRAQDINSESGRALATTLMGLYPAFSSVETAAAQATQAAAAQAVSLQKQIWTLTGDTASLRAAALAEVDPANRALQERVWALEDERAAQQAMASAIAGVSSASASAVDSLASLSDALRSALGTAGDETAAVTAAARARAQAQLGAALAIAKASGGSVLPDEAAISGALSTVSASSTGMFGSYEDYLRDRLRTANTIAGLASIVDARRGIPGFASGGYHSGGWRVVGENGPELEYTGPSTIVSNPDAKSLLSMDGLVSEIQTLRAEMRAGQVAIARAAQKIADLQAKWDNEGLPEVRV